ncbi:AAA family ATPase [Microbacteriaceae bacterium 4G12]
MLDDLKNRISSVFIGKSSVVDLVLVSLLADGHILLEDVPGTGKTLLAKTLAKTINGKFARIQFTPDVLPGDITGIEYFNPKNSEFVLRLGPIMANILLADEINRAMPRTQSSLLEAMEERQVTIEGVTTPLPRPFLVIATQNPIESQGTFPLPEAQLDRFLMKISIGYPSLADEIDIIRKFRVEQPIEEITPIVTLENIEKLQKDAKNIYVSPSIEQYIVQLAHVTREHDYIEVGVSPRGTLALVKATQAMALLSNRAYCTPEDVQFLLPHVWGHRMILSMEGELRTTKEDLLAQLLTEVDVPVEMEQQ